MLETPRLHCRTSLLWIAVRKLIMLLMAANLCIVLMLMCCTDFMPAALFILLCCHAKALKNSLVHRSRLLVDTW